MRPRSGILPLPPLSSQADRRDEELFIAVNVNIAGIWRGGRKERRNHHGVFHEVFVAVGNYFQGSGTRRFRSRRVVDTLFYLRFALLLVGARFFWFVGIPVSLHFRFAF